jgi:photosystem II stability/assembly factor-like uncharacterized protein
VPPTLSPRATRGLALIAVSLVGLVAVIAFHARPTLGRAASLRVAAAPQPDLASTMDWISAREGWISVLDRRAGTSTLFHTTDAGRHWTRQRVARGVETPELFDSRHGILISGAATLRTSDGGGHWQVVTLPRGAHGQQPAFADPRHGWVWDPPSAAVFGTVDGGAHWRRLDGTGLPGQMPVIPHLLGFRDGQHGWLAVGAALYGTADGGESWSALPLPLPGSGGAGADGFQIGPLSVAADGRGQLLIADSATEWVAATADGGATWETPLPLPPLASNLTTSRAAGAVSWAWSASQLQVTRDAGGHWTAVALPAWDLMRVDALDARTLWVAATVIDALGVPRWTLFSTVDAGLTWIPAITPALI